MDSQPTLKNLTNNKFGVPPEDQNVLLQQLGLPHVDSFNYMLDHGLDLAISDIFPLQFELPNGDRFKAQVIKCHLSAPHVPAGTIGSKKSTMFPSECRQSKMTYSGRFAVRIRWFLNDKEVDTFDKDLGDIPVMLKSKCCHLRPLKPKQLIEAGEHEQEWGGYFIAKGLHRLVRMLLMQRRNYPVCIQRSGWKQRGKMFSDLGISIRTVREDQTATTNVLHFITTGSAKLMFSFRKVMYYTPLVLILKCLCDHSDQYIYKKLIEGYEDDLYYSDCIQKMLNDLHEEKLHTPELCKNYLGMMFRVKFFECPPWYTNEDITDYILEKCILIHLKSNEDKFNMLIFMTQKLFQFVGDKCRLEGVDSVMMQEVLLGGHLYLQVLKEKLQYWLYSLKTVIMKKALNKENFKLNSVEMVNIARISGGISHSLDSFISTGSVSSVSGLGLMQSTGLTIVPENINFMRYMSHFKAVHRGSFFQEMRTTEARQLLPDAWGFICPVHTPDGTPCGLLNHLTMNCLITNIPDPEELKRIPSVLAGLGMLPYKQSGLEIEFKKYYVVQLDGRILGYVHEDKAANLVDSLRSLKIKHVIPKTTEIVMIPKKKHTAQFPGLFLFTTPARMMRPLINLKANQIELVGTFEQVYMDVCVRPNEIYKGLTTHMELSKDGFLSNLAQLIPMPDCNQSPRNMYQCQMGKQTMGTPCHNWDLEAETKLYRLQTPASPLFRPVHHDHIGLDDYPMGTNAIVAVISYTGYDMEDAMVINKASLERGLAHGSIYKTEHILLDHQSSYFCRDPNNERIAAHLDSDGLPYIGKIIESDSPFYCYYNADCSNYRVVNYSGKEDCHVMMVKLCVDMKSGKKGVNFTLRVSRNPSVGDKFASRAGQKGICSQKWPTEDLPFTESGLVPDIVFNPHGFPSRMTIAMMIEIMAGKSAAIHGLVHDASPFKFTEDNTAIDYFGKLLEAGGYNYYGTETMYSGIDGREMKAQIFFGIVHYQRLRHMVSDKWQVRSTGPIDILTRQPLKGRKRGGGVRFGEMERDSLISHGTSFLLQDRLLHCSDKCTVNICTSCYSLLGPTINITQLAYKKNFSESKYICRFCEHGDNISEIHMPYIFKFLVSELASCNINVKVNCNKI